MERNEYIDYENSWAALTGLMTEGFSWSGRERNCAYLNLRNGKFACASATAGLDFLDDGRSVAITDWDGDGDLDLWFKNRTGPQARLMINRQQPGHHFFALKLVGKTCNRDAIGARVELEAGGRKLMRTVMAGDGYLAQSSKWLHFGLGDADRIDSLTIHWPGGDSQSVDAPAVDARYVLQQGSAEFDTTSRPSVKLKPEPLDRIVPPTTRLVLKKPLPLPPAFTSELFRSGDKKRAKLINFWERSCAPCLVELGEFASNYDALTEAGLDIVALNLDKPETREQARTFFDEKIRPRMEGQSFPSIPASTRHVNLTQAIMDHVRELKGDLPIPTSLLVDRDGSLQIIYMGPVRFEDLLKDVKERAMQPDKPQLRGPYVGMWYFYIPRNLPALQKDLTSRGLEADADFYRTVERAESLRRKSGSRAP